MKHFFLFVTLLAAINVQAQTFEGRVEFEIEYTSIPAGIQSYEDRLPTQETVTIGADHVKIDGSTAFEATWTNVRKDDRSSGYQLWNVADRQLHVIKSKNELAEELSQIPAPLFRPTGESKVILGYLCQKATYNFPGSTDSYTVYYTNRLPSWAFDQLPGLSGFPLYYEYNRNGMVFIVRAVAIEATTIPQSEFSVPDGYETVSSSEFRQVLMELDY